MKKAQALLASALLAPAVVLAFETVDTLPWPSDGRFPAYEREEGRPTDFWLQGGAMRDDNLLRLESGGEADTVTRAGGGVRHVQRIIGRQRLRLEARADYYRFNRFSEFDHLAYSGLADWRWEIGNNLSGSIAAGRERRLVDLSETRATTRSMVTVTRLGASGGYLVTPRLRVRAGLAGADAERTDAEDADTRATSVTGGVDYVSPLGNTIGVEARGTEGEASVHQAVLATLIDNDYRERELSLVATYAIGPRLRADGRVGRTTRRYNDLPNRDFEGTTWRAAGEWLPGNKTSLALAFYKEPRSIIDVSAAHVVIRGVTFGPSWAVTTKLVLSARLLSERHVFEGDPAIGVAGALQRDEDIQVLRFGIGWEPARHWQASFAIDRGERESNIDGRDYHYSALTANLAWRY
jgi:hypothetical protein